MFSWFERQIDPFEDSKPTMPPNTLVGFCWHYAKPHWHLFLFLSILGASIAVMEISLFHFLGSLVTANLRN